MGDAEDTEYSTQPSDSQDKANFDELKRKLGHKDKQSFVKCLIEIYKGDPKQLNHIRESVYDYAKEKCSEFPHGKLVLRRSKNNDKQCILNKYSQDIYYLFHYVEGGIPDHVLQSKVLSRASIKSAGNQIEEDDDTSEQASIDDVTYSENESASLILSHVLQLKQCVASGSERMEERLTRLEMKQSNDIETLRHHICEKDEMIKNLTHKLHESEDRRSELRAELKLSNQENKTQRDYIMQMENELLRLNYSIDTKLKFIENKVSSLSTSMKNAKQCKQKSSDEAASPSSDHHILSQPVPQATSESRLPEETTATDTTDDTARTQEGSSHTARQTSENSSNTTTSSHGCIDLTDRNYNYDFTYDDNSKDTDSWKQVTASKNERQTTNTTSSKESAVKSYPIRSLGKTYKALEGVPRIKTKRLVLYNIKADQDFDTVKDLIYDYVQDNHVRVTYVRLMKRKEHYNYQDTYTVQVNVDFDDYERILSDRTPCDVIHVP